MFNTISTENHKVNCSLERQHYSHHLSVLKVEVTCGSRIQLNCEHVIVSLADSVVQEDRLHYQGGG